MNQIHRLECPIGIAFRAPYRVTFGYQTQRRAFSVWYQSEHEGEACDYIVTVTGDDIGEADLVASAVTEDGYHVFHLCRIRNTGDA